MDTAPENLSEVRDIVAYLWGKVLDNPAEAVDIATLNIAAVLADSALLGIDVTKGALSVLSELPDGTPEELRTKLDALANLEPGDDVRGPALELRELFPSAPPLPPSLKESE